MKTILKLEEVAMLAGSVFMFSTYNLAWWWYMVLFFLPDVGFAGYAINNKVGAYLYNMLHHKGIAVLIYMLGVWQHQDFFELAGIIMFGHASFDRIFGFGLKYIDSFHHTHLGYIGKKAES